MKPANRAKPENKVIKQGAYLLPNLLTTFNLICGIVVIIVSLESLADKQGLSGQPVYSSPAWFIFAAMIFDFLDGKVARWAHAVSDFGVKIDSLTDFISFGIAPLVLVYAALLQYVPIALQILSCGPFLFAGAWRLARFNCQSAKASQNFFTGLPIPAAATFLCSLVLVWTGHEESTPKFFIRFSSFPPAMAGVLASALLIVLAFLMVSRIPFPAFKKVNQRNLILLGGVGFFFGVLLLVLPLQNIVFLVMLLYLIFGLFQYLIERVIKLQNRFEQGEHHGDEHSHKREE